MCDCYEHPCLACNKEIPMHIGDFAVARNEIAVIHGKCLEQMNPRPDRFVMWEILEIDETESRVCGLSVGDRIAVVPLTEDAIETYEDNHPNVLECEIMVMREMPVAP